MEVKVEVGEAKRESWKSFGDEKRLENVKIKNTR